MFNASEVKVGSGMSKYQTAGVSEKVTVTEVNLLHNETYKTYQLQFKTINENDQAGLSKRLSLNTTVNPGKAVAGWTVSAKYLLTSLLSCGYTRTEAEAILDAKDEKDLTKKLETGLIGKSFRGLFSSREYQPGKFAIELYNTEPVGGTRLVYDPTSKYHNSKLETYGTVSNTTSGSSDLPF